MAEEEMAPLLPLVGDLLEWDEASRLPIVSAISPPSKIPWSMVCIRNHQKNGRDGHPTIFPPIDHENLHISPDLPATPDQIPHVHAVNQRISFSDSDSDTDSNSLSSFSPSDSSPPPRSPLLSDRPAADAVGLFASWSEILNPKVNCVVQFFCRICSSSRGMFPTFRSAVFAAVLVAFLYFRRRRRLKGGEGSRDRLLGIIQERDEKINKLLDEISQMNRVLIAIHKVPTSPSP